MAEPIETLDTGRETFSSIINSIPSIEDSSTNYLRDMYILRDEYFAKIPEESKVEIVRSAWQELWGKAMLSLTPEQMHRLGDAFVFSAVAHKDQRRKSGDPYIIHTLSAALILAGMRLDMATLEAALLHDTLEDTQVTAAELQEKFGYDVYMLVDGVTKLARDDVKEFMSREDLTGENLRHMFIVMAKDIRVVLIKLADRLHNMRTLDVMRPEKQQRIARETMEIYAPLAHRLGIYQIKRELEDLSFRYLHPNIYAEVERRVKKRMPQMEEVIAYARKILEERLQKENIPCRIKGRSKHYYSIYEKMQRKKISFDELYDILAVRVLVADVSTCYAVLGVVHALWLPVPGQFDDYIANPKSNMYQSLHTTVMVSGVPLEVQIRTYEMNHFAEYGIAAHWVYKEGGNKKLLKGLNEKLMLVRQVMEAGQEGEDTKEFVDILKNDILLTSELYVFTPDGKPMILPNGSTVLDFAYAVHTEIGNHCAGAMINGRIVPLNTQLHSGDRVKILTAPQTSPSKDWLNIVSSPKTKSKIRSFFRQAEKAERDEKLERGWKLVERELRRRGLADVKREDFSNIDDQLISVGSGTVGASEAAQKLSQAYLQHHVEPQTDPVDFVSEPLPKKKDNKSDVLVEGEGGVSVTFASCCDPIPGDEIVGYASMRRGITIHRAECRNVSALGDERKISVSWALPDYSLTGGKRPNMYTARLYVEGENRRELVADTTRAVGLEGTDIAGMKVGMAGESLMRMKIDVRVRDLSHLYSTIARINEVRGIITVERE
ncbi:MAG: bifunctional (p)ppGpp synthetase/guanosine-3',5'-bis(diphosphate) 3'-pyrophosphohydrolase [Synergistaceae bacterium]|nr:bifunctional (p)ppGpp synthetase/guanosine-3',5'-bis(diphosphate) 3'-pyrophosphohydrolase [Synergistaceae bacterium]